MILSAQSIRKRVGMITPFFERGVFDGMSYGLTAAGYDIRIAESHRVSSGGYILASTIESFVIPDDVLGIVHDKSTWARRGIALQNTVIEPGWIGDSLTLEISNHSRASIYIEEGAPIAQVIFHRLDEPTEIPYRGKYQNQERGPQVARYEHFLSE